MAKVLNDKQKIIPTPNSITGVKKSLRDRLILRIRYLRASNTSAFLENYQLHKQVRLKISGNGTRVGRNLHMVNRTFTLMTSARFLSAGMSPILNWNIEILLVLKRFGCLKQHSSFVSNTPKEWTKFNDLIIMHSLKQVDSDGNNFGTEAKQWVETFGSSVYHTKHVTHTFML